MFEIVKHTQSSMQTVPLNKRIQNMFSDCNSVFLHVKRTDIYQHHTWVLVNRDKNFMTFCIFTIKGELNVKI